MFNARAILGLEENASKKEITLAYREKSALHHPDKGGDADLMKLINQARDELLQQAEDAEFITTCIDDLNELLRKKIIEPIDYSEDRISTKYRELYSAWVDKFSQEEVKQHLAYMHFKKFSTDLYYDVVLDCGEIYITEYKDLFDLLEQKKYSTECEDLEELSVTLTPQTAIKIFTKFIEGKCFGDKLIKARKLFTDHLDKISTTHATYKLYNGISEVLHLESIISNEESALLAALNKVTSYIRQNTVTAMPYCVALLQNLHFRNLFSQALHLLWQGCSNSLYKDDRTDFIDLNTTKSYLGVLAKQVLTNERINQENIELLKVVSYIKKIFDFETLVSEELKPLASSYREQGFAILDHLSILLRYADYNMIINILMQAGVYFQIASSGKIVNKKKADQFLALHAYMEAISLASRATPDLEIYTISNCLKFIASFNYYDNNLEDLISSLQSKLLSLIDLFPVFIPLQPNINFVRNTEQTLGVIRNFLHTLVNIIEQNKTATSPIPIAHEYVKILYQAYEANVKCWYLEYYDPKLENKFRLELMELLLRQHNWTFADLDPYLFSYIAMPRDQQGWALLTNPLKIITPEIQSFYSLEGMEINYKTREVVFTVSKLIKDYATNKYNTCNVADIAEMLAKNIIGGSFSLDLVDPEMMYHPFNTMRFAPKDLYQTQFLNTMLLTDYILKFLTTGQEVQGTYPYDFRSIQNLISHLPPKLKKIIDNFHANQQHISGSIHRFWIEAQEITVAETENSEQYKAAITDLKMVVKKHTMQRDHHGNLVDTSTDHEGWDLYVLTNQELFDLYKGNKKIMGYAMMFVENQCKVSFILNSKIYKQAGMSIHQFEQVKALATYPRDTSGKIKVTIDNSMLVYKLIFSLATSNKEATRFSKEYVFAQEFTDNYDEFGKYIPEFARLKELSKISASIKILTMKQMEAKHKEENLRKLLDSLPTWEEKDHHISNNEDYFNLPSQGDNLTTEEKNFAIFKHNNTKFIKSILPQNLYKQRLIEIQKSRANRSDAEAIKLAKQFAQKDFQVAKEHLQQTIVKAQTLLAGLVNIGLGSYAREEDDINLELECLWVPASVRHHVAENNLLFVYGGVRVLPRVNVINSSNPNFTRIMSNAFAEHNRMPVNSSQVSRVSAFAQQMAASTRAPTRAPTSVYQTASAAPVRLSQTTGGNFSNARAFSSNYQSSSTSFASRTQTSTNSASASRTSASSSALNKTQSSNSVSSPNLRVDTHKPPGSSSVTSAASNSNSTQISRQTQRLIGKTDRYKSELFERAGKTKDQTTLNAAKIELQGKQIDLAIEKGVSFDHIEKVENAQQGLLKHLKNINDRLSVSVLLSTP